MTENKVTPIRTRAARKPALKTVLDDAAKAERTARKPAAAKPAKPAAKPAKPAAKRAAAKPAAKAAPKVKAVKPALPKGYHVPYPHRTYLLRKVTGARLPKSAPEILVMCRKHGTTTEATGVADADRLGAVPNRPDWCPQCKIAAKAKAAK